MISLALRRFVVLPLYQLCTSVEHNRFRPPTGIDTGADPSTGRVMLRRVRDMRHSEARLLAERLGSTALKLGFVGVLAQIVDESGVRTVFDVRNGVIGEFEAVASKRGTVWRCAGPGLGKLTYFVGSS